MPDSRVTQEFVEPAVTKTTQTRVTQEFVEVAVLGRPPVILSVSMAGVGNLSSGLTGDFTMTTSMPGVGNLDIPDTRYFLDWDFGRITRADSPAKGHKAVRIFICRVGEHVKMPGVGNLVGNLELTEGIYNQFTSDGVGDLVLDLHHSRAMNVTMPGVGNLITDGFGNILFFTQMAGVGNLQATSQLDAAIRSTMTGIGNLVIPTLGGDFTMRSSMAGVGNLPSFMIGTWYHQTLMHGIGNLRGPLGGLVLRKPEDDFHPPPIGEEELGDVWWTIE